MRNPLCCGQPKRPACDPLKPSGQAHDMLDIGWSGVSIRDSLVVAHGTNAAGA